MRSAGGRGRQTGACRPRGAGLPSFIGTTTIFGTPVDVSLQELAVESFFPADAATARALAALAPNLSRAR